METAIALSPGGHTQAKSGLTVKLHFACGIFSYHIDFLNEKLVQRVQCSKYSRSIRDGFYSSRWQSCGEPSTKVSTQRTRRVPQYIFSRYISNMPHTLPIFENLYLFKNSRLFNFIRKSETIWIWSSHCFSEFYHIKVDLQHTLVKVSLSFMDDHRAKPCQLEVFFFNCFGMTIVRSTVNQVSTRKTRRVRLQSHFL